MPLNRILADVNLDVVIVRIRYDVRVPWTAVSALPWIIYWVIVAKGYLVLGTVWDF